MLGEAIESIGALAVLAVPPGDRVVEDHPVSFEARGSIRRCKAHLSSRIVRSRQVGPTCYEVHRNRNHGLGTLSSPREAFGSQAPAQAKISAEGPRLGIACGRIQRAYTCGCEWTDRFFLGTA